MAHFLSVGTFAAVAHVLASVQPRGARRVPAASGAAACVQITPGQGTIFNQRGAIEVGQSHFSNKRAKIAVNVERQVAF